MAALSELLTPFFARNSDHHHHHHYTQKLKTKMHLHLPRPTIDGPSLIRKAHAIVPQTNVVAAVPCSASPSSAADFTQPDDASDVQVEEERAQGAPDRTNNKDRRRAVRVAWEKLVRWSRSWRSRMRTDVLERTRKVVVFGGGSSGTSMAAHVTDRKT